MSTCADLEITLRHRDGASYAVEFRFSQPDGLVDTQPPRQSPGIEFDVKALRRYHLNNEDYGRILAEQLFGSSDVRKAFNQARIAAHAQNVPLRVRFRIDDNATELHSLRWETLRDPDDPDSTLFTNERYYFSRYLSSLDYQPVSPRARRELRALVAIANPNDLDPEQLAPVNVTDELARVNASLGKLKVTVLGRVEDDAQYKGPDPVGLPTLKKIRECLREDYDIFYLVCHGMLEKDEPMLWLENEDGDSDVVSGRKLAARIRELRHRPYLFVLASCQSAGTGDQRRSSDEGALAALGPRLARIGVPAVLAMHGNITQKSLDAFMPKFFQELRKDGHIDRAVALARGAVRDRPDWWMPALFMRIKSGRLWYTPGFSKLTTWPAVLQNLEHGRCVPIIGYGLAEWLLGSTSEIAQRWAETYGFPMAPEDRKDLPQVAQYLDVTQQYMFPRDELMKHVRQELLSRYGDQMPDGSEDASLDQMIEEVGRLHREQDPNDPYRVLAEFDLPIYITTTPANLLESALKAAGKDPRSEICRWNKDIEWLPSVFNDGSYYRPTPDRPLVYHLYGSFQVPESLVLTEDDYFDYLIGVTKNDVIPPVVERTLVSSALMFLGFRLDDWGFRVLFRSLRQQEGSHKRQKLIHVAVQVDPEEVIEPDGAREYLENYFQEAKISIYWGSAEEFIKELKKKREAA